MTSCPDALMPRFNMDPHRSHITKCSLVPGSITNISCLASAKENVTGSVTGSLGKGIYKVFNLTTSPRAVEKINARSTIKIRPVVARISFAAPCVHSHFHTTTRALFHLPLVFGCLRRMITKGSEMVNYGLKGAIKSTPYM